MITKFFITYIVYLLHPTNTTSVPKADTTNPENHISPQDANIINLMVCEAYIETEKVWCSQTFTSSRRYDSLQWGQNTLALPKILDPIECKKHDKIFKRN